jgi:type II secretory pathway component GspD/PulD (secretin)
LLIKKIFLILLIGMFLWVGISCAPRPLRGTGAIKGEQIQSQDRSTIRSDIGAGQKSPSDTPLQETSKQAIAPHRTAPAPARNQDMPPVVKSEPARPQPPSAQTPATRGGQFTLNFDDADVYAVIQTVFGEILKVNYAVDPRVKGRVTFRAIAPIPAEKVLPLMEVILKLNGIGIVEEGGLYRIVPISDTQRRPQLFVYPVQNNKAKDIAALLQQIFMGRKGGVADRSPAPGKLGQAGAPSPELAPGPSQVRPSVMPSGEDAIVSESVKIIADEVTNTIIVLSTPEDNVTIAKAIQQIDFVPRQVVIEAMIASVSLTDNLSLGLSAMFKGSVSNYNTNIGVNPGSLNINPAALTQAGFTFLATDAAGVVVGMLSALATESKAKVLAAPHILVSDNRDAKIQVGQQIPLITSETYGVAGVTPQRNYSYRDIGIILKVKPRINEGGLVSLEISQEISTYEKIKVGGEDQLLLNKTDASTTLVVQDGQTIVIGGLIREDTTKSSSGIPFFSRIPIIGWLFGGTEDDTKRQELIILLTPRVIKNQKEAKDLSGKMINKMTESSQGRIKEEDILGNKLPKDRGGVKPPNGSDPSAQPKP